MYCPTGIHSPVKKLALSLQGVYKQLSVCSEELKASKCVRAVGQIQHTLLCGDCIPPFNPDNDNLWAFKEIHRIDQLKELNEWDSIRAFQTHSYGENIIPKFNQLS